MFTHKTKSCVSPTAVTLAVVNSFFLFLFFYFFFLRNDFWKRDGKNARGTFWRDVGGYLRRLSRNVSEGVGVRENCCWQQNTPWPLPPHWGFTWWPRRTIFFFFFYVSSCWLLTACTGNTKINLVTLWSLFFVVEFYLSFKNHDKITVIIHKTRLEFFENNLFISSFQKLIFMVLPFSL